MLKQYVVLQEPAAVVADRLQREQTTLRKKVADLSEQNRRLQALQSETGNRLEQTETALHKVKSQYEKLQEGAKDVTETLAERDRLQQENQEQRQQIASLKEENHYLWRNNILRWFFAGAGVLAIGWLMGRRPPRRFRSF
jgi:SH3 domain protein